MGQVRKKNFERYKATQFCISESLEHVQLLKKHMALQERVNRRNREAQIEEEKEAALEEKRERRRQLLQSAEQRLTRRREEQSAEDHRQERQTLEEMQDYRRKKEARRREIEELSKIETELLLQLNQTKEVRRGIIKKSNNLKQLSNRDIDEIFNKGKTNEGDA
jgi:hypothetical protein